MTLRKGQARLVIDNPAQPDGFAWINGHSEEKLVSALRDVDELCEVSLYRQRSANHKHGMHFCESWSADLVSFAILREAAKLHIEDIHATTFFRVHIKRDDVLVPNGNLAFSIAGRTRPPETESDRKNKADAGQMGQYLQAITDQMAEDRRLLRELLLENRNRDPRADMLQQVQFARELREAFVGPGAAAPAALPAPGTVPADPLSALSAQLDGLSKLKRSMADSGFIPAVTAAVEKVAETEDGASLIKTAIDAAPKLLGDVLELWRNQQQLKALELKAKGVAVDPPPAATAPPAGQPAADLPQGAEIMFRHLQKMAADNSDIEEPAQFIVGNPLPRDFVSKLLQAGTPFAELARIHPQVMAFPVWYGELLDAVRAKLAEGQQQ